MSRAAAPRRLGIPTISCTAKRVLGRVGFYCLLAVIIFYTVFPFYWAIVSSLKSGSELFKVEFGRPIRPGTTMWRCSASSRSGATS